MQTVVKEVLPQKTRWSHRALARFLCSDKNTIKVYAEQIAPVISDFRAQCQRNPDGSIKSGQPLSSYQAWVVTQLIKLAREVRKDLNGTAFRAVVKSSAIKMSAYLSKESYEREIRSQNVA